MKRTVISKHAKKKKINGKYENMEEVVYHWEDNGGTKRSRTAHEIVKE